MVREEAISVVLGYTSIACWLGAQFPQIIVNWRRKSVDGLALPFLANWLLGDTTNLIGCILTNQLPFQTYLATYFVFVDVCLVSQFIYYDAPRHTKALSILTSSSARHSRTSLVPPSSIAYSPETHTIPRSRSHISRSRSRSYSMDPHLRAAIANMALATSELEARPHELHASEVDTHGSQGRRRGRGGQSASLEGLPESIVANPLEHEWGRRIGPREHETGDEAEDAESESTPSAMIDSFQSEGGGRGRGKGKHVSWTGDNSSRDRSTRRLSLDLVSQDPASPSTAPSTVRGRQLTRSTVYDSPIGAEVPVEVDPLPRSRRPSAASAVSAAASRRSASIVFLGVFVLFGLSSHTSYRRSGSSEGGVLSTPPRSEAFVQGDTLSSLQFTHVTPLPSPSVQMSVSQTNNFEVHISASGRDTQRLVGRVSAWTCTTLYLTSRLPQIWKNFVRKSVEGLSMYLFVFAFLGNFFYVLSILTNSNMDLPEPRAKQFLRDSIPYLLGSGGTLLFDVTIVLQSFVYATNRRRPRTRARRKSLIAAGGEEERGLLATDNEVAR